LEREFGRDSIKELRLAPLNLLKKIVNKRSNLYKTPPVRTPSSELESDQNLVDFYTEDLDFNEKMDKWNRYFTLHSNVVAYPIPRDDRIELLIVPPYLYSAVPNHIDRTKSDVWVFSSFVESGHITPRDEVPSVSREGFTRERGFKTTQDLVDSRERHTDQARRFIFWTDEMHATTDIKGNAILMDPNRGEEQFINPIGISPVINLAKDRDNEFWATQFEDSVDLSLAIMLGWTDLLTIAKHQGFSQLVVASAEEPKQLTIGINKAIWLKQQDGIPIPTISYVQANSPLAEYKDLLMELLGLLLTTANLNPKEIGGTNSARNFSSGFQALIESADILEARKMDMNPMRRGEQELWFVIAKWHNLMIDTQTLNDEARSLGKFSEDFGINIQFAEVRPLESEQERIQTVKDLRGEGLLTRSDALKKLHPDMSDEQIETKLKEIDEELSQLRQKAVDVFKDDTQKEE